MHVTCMKDATADHRSGRDVYGGIFQSIQSSVEYYGADTADFFRSKDPYKVIQTEYQHPGSFSWTKQWAAAGIINSFREDKQASVCKILIMKPKFFYNLIKLFTSKCTLVSLNITTKVIYM